MRKKEQLLWDAMKSHLHARLWLQRIENVVGDGMPDVYVGATGKWVELKAPSRVPARSTTPLLGQEGLRQSQVNWFLKHATMRGAPDAYVLIRTPERELLLVGEDFAAGINKMTLAELRDASVAGDWLGIEVVLS